MRETLERILLKTVRLYTFHTPLPKGKYRLYQTALQQCRAAPQKITVKSADGRRFEVDLTGGMHDSVFFFGEYEPAVSAVVSSIVRRGDVCLDVGANFGWFATLLSGLTGDGGQSAVHAFEPMPDVFDGLKINVRLNDLPDNVFLNNLALGDEIKRVSLHRFADLPSGHSSLSDMGKEEFQTFDVPMTTLDSYLAERAVEQVDFIKLDIEGAEMMFLRGATKLFEQPVPPFIIAEMALGTTRGFGYLPNDLIEFIRRRADYKFYALDETAGVLEEIEGFTPEQIGANVLCVPRNCDARRLEKLKFRRAKAADQAFSVSLF